MRRGATLGSREEIQLVVGKVGLGRLRWYGKIGGVVLCCEYSIRTRVSFLLPLGKWALQLGNGMHTEALIGLWGRSDLAPSQDYRSGGRGLARLASGPDSSGDLTFTNSCVLLVDRTYLLYATNLTFTREIREKLAEILEGGEGAGRCREVQGGAGQMLQKMLQMGRPTF